MDCDSGWTVIDGDCFKYFPSPQDASTAEANCVSHGAHLAKIETSAQNSGAFGLTNGGKVLIGLTDEDSEGSWRWRDGSTPGYTSWASGQPDSTGDEDYAYFWGSGTWHDCSSYCDGNPAGYICSKNVAYSGTLVISITT